MCDTGCCRCLRLVTTDVDKELVGERERIGAEKIHVSDLAPFPQPRNRGNAVE